MHFAFVYLLVSVKSEPSPLPATDGAVYNVAECTQMKIILGLLPLTRNSNPETTSCSDLSGLKWLPQSDGENHVTTIAWGYIVSHSEQQLR